MLSHTFYILILMCDLQILPFYDQQMRNSDTEAAKCHLRQNDVDQMHVDWMYIRSSNAFMPLGHSEMQICRQNPIKFF